MPFQPGNQLAKGNKKPRMWEEALKRAIKARQSTDPQALEKLADKLLIACDNSDIHALKELADRLDGKAIQSLEVKSVGPFEEMDTNELAGLVGRILSGATANDAATSGSEGTELPATGSVPAVH